MALFDLFSSGVNSSAQSAAASNFNPLNLIQNGRNYLDTLSNKFILKPTNAKGINGFVFDYEGETTAHVQAEITDHYSEQNTFFNDHAAQKPVRIVLHGYVSELAVTPNSGLLGALATLQGKLTTLPAILGKYTPAIIPKIAALTSKATNVVNTVDNAINRAQNLVGLFVGSQVAPSKQQKAFQQLYSMWLTNQVFTLNTPFNYFRSMMIETITMTQDETTKEWSELSVTVKEVRFLTTPTKGSKAVAGVVNSFPSTAASYGKTPQFALQTNDGRSMYQVQDPINNGRVQGVNVNPLQLSTGF